MVLVSEEFSNLGLDLERTGSTGSVQVIFRFEPRTAIQNVYNLEKYRQNITLLSCSRAGMSSSSSRSTNSLRYNVK